MVRGLPTHEGFLKPALRWSWPRRDRGRVARGQRLGTSPSPTFFSVGVVSGFPIAIFPRGYGSWITHPRRLSKAGPTVELASEGWGRAGRAATAGDKPQPYIFLCGHCSWFPDCRFFRAAMVRGLPTHEGFLKPALRWSWPRRDRGRVARGQRLGTSPSPTFFSVGVVSGFPIAIFPRGYGSWITHPRRLSKAGPTVELASEGWGRAGRAATAGDKPQPYIFLCGRCSWFPDCRFCARLWFVEYPPTKAL